MLGTHIVSYSVYLEEVHGECDPRCSRWGSLGCWLSRRIGVTEGLAILIQSHTTTTKTSGPLI